WHLFPDSSLPAGSAPPTLITGSLDLPGLSTVNTSLPFGTSANPQSASAIYSGIGPQKITLTFAWGCSAYGPPTIPFVPSEFGAAVRLGSDGPSPCGVIVPAGTYPGVNPRTRNDDGHFVTVRCIDCVKSFCTDFNVTASSTSSPLALEGFEGVELTNPG